MAAKMFEFRKPKRTRTESAAQPIAEKIATISANNRVPRDLAAMELSNKPSGAGYATAKTLIGYPCAIVVESLKSPRL
ncbi:MAG TPA: hypothetical protein VK603_08590, partial [Candidatus Saccharimonadales bacterium]|nr:hypothetical protein [Candidatus Saccharimonadales bacterium]